MPKKKQKLDLKQYHKERLAKLNAKAPFVLRITEWKDKPIPILVVKERQFRDDDDARDAEGQRRKARPVLIERGSLYGEPQHRCLPALRRILEPVSDEAGIPLELNRYMTFGSEGNVQLSGILTRGEVSVWLDIRGQWLA